MLTNIWTIAAAVVSLAIASVLAPQPVEPLATSRNIKQQDTVVKRIIPRIPAVFVKDDKGIPQPMSIKNLDVEVQITGSMSRTTLDMTVYNPHNRVLEGEFSFPLNDGQTVARFALDINGKLRDAVVVPKTKARETFEEVIRTKIDPAILEWTRDNSFKTRIYPLPARGTRRVVVAYEQELSNTESGLAYTIPFAYEEEIESFTFSANVAAFGTRPSLTGGEERFNFTPKGRNYEVSFKRGDVLLNRPFNIAVPVKLDDDLVRVTEFNGTKFFGAFLALPTALKERPAPRVINLLWDASLSGTRRDINSEVAALDALFAKLQDVIVHYATFSNTVRTTGSVNVHSGNWTSLKEALLDVPFDGATQIGAVPFVDTEADITILVSDGINTIGKGAPDLGSAPIFVLSSGVPADHDVLRSFASVTGGAYLPVSGLSPEKTVEKILGAERQITDITVVDGDVRDIRPIGNIPVQRVTSLSGKLFSDGATLRITSSVAGEDTRFDEIQISHTQHADTSLSVSRMWANRELQMLNANRVVNEDRITALGMEYTIVTPNTSLLVLERLFDYVRFNIKPPANEPEMVKQFTQQRKGIVNDSAAKEQLQRRSVEHMIAKRRELLKRNIDADSIVAMEMAHRKAALAKARKDSLKRVQAKAEYDERLRRGSSLSGKILDAEGKPIPGGRIVVQGTAFGANAGPDGTYEISRIPYGENTFQVSSAGYQSRTYIRRSLPHQADELDIYLDANEVNDEVVVTMDREMVRSASGGSSSLRLQKSAPVTTSEDRDNLAEEFSTQPGIQASGNGFVVRGSRKTETQVLVDGLPVTDYFVGGLRNDNTRVGDTVTMRAPRAADMKLAKKDTRESWSNVLSKLATEDLYTTYLRLRADYMNITVFYLDVSDILEERGEHDLALRVVSNLAELRGEDHRDLRILGHRLMQMDESFLATTVFEDVLRIRDEEPQSYRDLGLAYASHGQYHEAAEQFMTIMTRSWHGRFPEVELIAAMEYSKLIAEHKDEIGAEFIDRNLLLPVNVGLRVVLTWDADNCDMDLWVEDPLGEVCKYNHRKTRIGGNMSRDLTGGYGPEEFILPNAAAGEYKIKVHYYGNRQQNVSRPTTIQVNLFTNYGSTAEEQKAITMRLDGKSRVVEVGSIAVN